MSSLDRIKKKREQLLVEGNKNLSSTDKSMERIKSLRNELSTTGKIDYGDIAPIKFDNTSTKEEDKKRSWFSAGAFDDGYDFGDVTKTILGTVADVGTNVVKGLTSMGEGIGKLGAGGVAQIADWIGQDEYADKVRNRLAGKDEEYNEFWNKISPTANVNRVSDKLDTSSFIGEKSDDLVSSAGNLLGSMAAQSVGIPWWVTMGTSSAGQELENAYKSGATNGEAWTSAAISGASEILFEKLSGGIKFGGRTLDEGLKRTLSNAITKKTAQTLTKLGVDMAGEGLEEVLTEVTSNIGKKLTYEDEKTWGEVLASEEAIDNYIESFVGGAVMGGVFNSGKVVSSLKTGRDYDTGLTANEQKVVDSEVAKRTEGKNLTKKQIAEIETEVKNELEKGYISTDTIESVLGGDTYNNLKSTRDNKTKIENEIKELESKKNADITVKEMEHLKDLREQLKGIDTNTLETDLQGKMGQIIKSDGYLQRSYQEKAKRGQKFTYDASKVTNEFEKAALESASKVMNDTNRSHEFVEPVVKLAKDKGTYYEFTNNAELEKSNYDVKGKQVNGLVTVEENGKKKILINVDSAKALNTIVGHETTHLLEGTTEYQELQDAIFNYAKTKGDFDTRQASLYSLYKGIKGADVNSELTADLVGDYLFTDNNFISELSTQKPTVFQKIKELIDDLVVRFKGTKEEKALREVQKKFKEAYRQSGTQTNTDTQYSMVGKKGVDRLAKNDSSYQSVIDNYNEALKMKEEGKTNREIWQETLWIQDEEGNWKIELSDRDARLNTEPEKNKKYKLKDVLKHDRLYEVYPEMKNTTVKFKNIKDNVDPNTGKHRMIAGYYNSFTGTISVNNKLLEMTNGNKHIIDTILHEVQHKIQKYEGFNYGYIASDEAGYFNNLGEREAKDTTRRRNLSYKERMQIAPESLFEENSNSWYNNANGGNRSEVNQKNKRIFPKNLYDANERSISDRRGSRANVQEIENPYYIDEELDNSSFFNTQYSLSESVPLENRVSGDELLDAQDLIDEIKSVGGEVDKNGYVTVYHQTTDENAQKIKETGKMISKELDIFFSTSKDAQQSEGKGQTKLAFKIPAEKLVLDDIFSDNADVKIPLNGKKSIDVSDYLIDTDADYSLSNPNEIAPRNPNLTYGEDVKLQVEETIAPLQEEIQTLTETVQELKEQIAPVRDEYASLTEEDLPYLEQQYNEAPKEDIAPPEIEENTPVSEDEITSTKSLFETRNYEKVGNRKVNAYQYDNPEVKPYFQEAARSMIDDLAYSLKGQRFYNDQVYYDTNGEQGFFGINRFTANDIAELLDGVDGKYKLSYKDIEKGLKAIIEDHGAENNAASKRIEFYLDKRLREGFTTLDGVEIPANQEYLDLLEAIETTDYYNSIPIGEAPVENVDVPTSDISNTKASEEIAPIKEQETQQPVEENKNLSIKDSNALKLKNLEKALDKYNSDAEESLKAFNELILEKKKQYSGLSNRNTQKANNLLQQITRIETQRDNAQVEYERKMNNVQQRIDKMNSKDFKTAEQRMTKQQEYRQQARELIGDTSTWQDKKMGIQYQIHTFKRNLRDIVKGVDGKTDLLKADAIYEEYEGKYDKNEAKLKVEYNKIMNPYADMKLTEQEHIYTQMLGEFKYNPETTLTKDVVDSYYNKNKSKIDTNKVNNAIESARKTYDELFNRINERLKEQGMKELEYRRGYFPHFIEEKQGLLAKIFDWKIHKDDIPTDIAGLTELNNPERSWQKFNKHRESDITDYNFGKGLETYVRGALDWIYHIEDIQKRRAFENEIRYQHSEKGVQEQIEAIYGDTELDTDQIQERIDSVYKNAQNPLNNFITDFRNATNRLANKKSTMDRGVEYATNRQIYSTMTNLSNRVSGNMIGGSISSALTNFIPITQSWGEVNPLSSLKAARETIKNAVIDDGTIAKSTFLTNRLVKNENLYKTGWDKAKDKIAIMTDVIDSFTSQTVWRSKYNENIANGMSEMEAIANADNFAKNVIAGRSRGNEPTIFHSKNPFIKMFTSFQTEVSNQYDYMFKDMPTDVGNQSKAKLIKGYASMFIGAYVYNTLYSSLVGRDAAFDPIGLVEDILKELGFGDDEEEEEKSASEKFTAITEDLVQQLPFVGGLFGGGRMPISAAIPYDNPIEMVKGTATDLLEALDEEKREKAVKDLWTEWQKPISYLALPVGGGQLTKTIQGLSMYDDDLPVAGSYTNSGDLRFTADESLGGMIKSALFGRWASDSAQEYVDSGFKTVKKSNIDEMVDLDMSSTEYRKYRNGLNKAGSTNEEKINYINSLDVSDEHKNIMANNVLKRDYDVDMSDYGEMSGYDEFDYSYKNPDKYKVITQIDTFDNFNSYKDDIASIKDQFSEDNGYSTKQRKAAVQQYINSLNLDIPQKIMLEKMAGGYSIKNYENYMFEYIQSLPMTAEEKQAIHNQLFD